MHSDLTPLERVAGHIFLIAAVLALVLIVSIGATYLAWFWMTFGG